MQRELIFRGKHLQTRQVTWANTPCTWPFVVNQPTNQMRSLLPAWPRLQVPPQCSSLLYVFTVEPSPLAPSARPRFKVLTSTSQPNLPLSSESLPKTIKGKSQAWSLNVNYRYWYSSYGPHHLLYSLLEFYRNFEQLQVQVNNSFVTFASLSCSFQLWSSNTS